MTDILFTPARIGALTLPNRIVMPSMTTRSADADGLVTADTHAYYLARAHGGVGLITVEMAAPEPVGRHRQNELGLHDDRFLPGLTGLVDALHDAGAKAMIQLGHGGGHTRPDVCGATPIAPSAVPHPVYEIRMETIVPEAMSLARIAQTTEAFVKAALRARKAGFDAVEIHAAHGYLISQFLCPAENRRDDAYGGSLENRARFGLDILRRIKKAAPDLPVVFRVNGDDWFPGGMGFDEGHRVAVWAAESGADAVHITAGHYRSQPSAAVMIPPMAMPDAPFLDFAAAVKADVSVPVIAVGRLGDPRAAAAALESGKADFIALGRSLLADPEWPNRVKAGQQPRRCLACNSCVNDMRGGDRLHCIINPATGRERERLQPGQGLRIAVIGAGPAGLSYALWAAPGNAVTLFERQADAGGAWRLAGKAPTFQEVEAAESAFRITAASLVARCREAGVAVRFGVDPLATPESLAPYDRVVVATGARYRFGLGPITRALLESGLARTRLFRKLFANDHMRNWFYYRARQGRRRLPRPGRDGQTVIAIGDARQAGKTAEAILDAWSALAEPGPGAGAIRTR